MKKWWFSIFCWFFALVLFVYVIIAINLFDEELLFYTLVLMSCITPTLLITIIGLANMPRKENKDE